MQSAPRVIRNRGASFSSGSRHSTPTGLNDDPSPLGVSPDTRGVLSTGRLAKAEVYLKKKNLGESPGRSTTNTPASLDAKHTHRLNKRMSTRRLKVDRDIKAEGLFPLDHDEEEDVDAAPPSAPTSPSLSATRSRDLALSDLSLDDTLSSASAILARARKSLHLTSSQHQRHRPRDSAPPPRVFSSREFLSLLQSDVDSRAIRPTLRAMSVGALIERVGGFVAGREPDAEIDALMNMIDAFVAHFPSSRAMREAVPEIEEIVPRIEFVAAWQACAAQIRRQARLIGKFVTLRDKTSVESASVDVYVEFLERELRWKSSQTVFGTHSPVGGLRVAVKKLSEQVLQESFAAQARSMRLPTLADGLASLIVILLRIATAFLSMQEVRQGNCDLSAEVIVLREVLYAIESGAELIQLLDRVTAGNMSRYVADRKALEDRMVAGFRSYMAFLEREILDSWRERPYMFSTLLESDDMDPLTVCHWIPTGQHIVAVHYFHLLSSLLDSLLTECRNEVFYRSADSLRWRLRRLVRFSKKLFQRVEVCAAVSFSSIRQAIAHLNEQQYYLVINDDDESVLYPSSALLFVSSPADIEPTPDQICELLSPFSARVDGLHAVIIKPPTSFALRWSGRTVTASSARVVAALDVPALAFGAGGIGGGDESNSDTGDEAPLTPTGAASSSTAAADEPRTLERFQSHDVTFEAVSTRKRASSASGASAFSSALLHGLPDGGGLLIAPHANALHELLRERANPFMTAVGGPEAVATRLRHRLREVRRRLRRVCRQFVSSSHAQLESFVQASSRCPSRAGGTPGPSLLTSRMLASVSPAPPAYQRSPQPQRSDALMRRATEGIDARGVPSIISSGSSGSLEALYMQQQQQTQQQIPKREASSMHSPSHAPTTVPATVPTSSQSQFQAHAALRSTQSSGSISAAAAQRGRPMQRSRSSPSNVWDDADDEENVDIEEDEQQALAASPASRPFSSAARPDVSRSPSMQTLSDAEPSKHVMQTALTYSKWSIDLCESVVPLRVSGGGSSKIMMCLVEHCAWAVGFAKSALPNEDKDACRLLYSVLVELVENADVAAFLKEAAPTSLREQVAKAQRSGLAALDGLVDQVSEGGVSALGLSGAPMSVASSRAVSRSASSQDLRDRVSRLDSERDTMLYRHHLIGRLRSENQPEYVTPAPLHRFRWTQLSEKPIGSGAHGDVFKAINRRDMTFIAVKSISLSHLRAVRGPAYQDSILEDVSRLVELQHKNIVQYFGVEQDQNNVYILMEYCSEGSLARLLNSYGKFHQAMLLHYTHQILEGLVFLHSLHIVHRDIKPDNVLIDAEGRVKLADFGSAILNNDVQRFSGLAANSLIGTPNYIAPEPILGRPLTAKSDVWSVGCTILHMATAVVPWKGFQPPAIYYQLGTGGRPPIAPGAVDEQVEKILEGCFQQDPANRLTAAGLLSRVLSVMADTAA